MPAIFAKAIEQITPADVEDLIGWPESLTVEYKEHLPARDGRADAWMSGGGPEVYTRDKLFKEVVAFANASGGHLILGIGETENAPPAARCISPIPRCVDLAERLLRMAQSIDPPIPLLLVQAVETEGDAGVVIFRVPPSRSAPHRSTDKDCYTRRGTNSMAMSMGEIRSLTMNSNRGEERVDAEFFSANQQFLGWLATPLNDDMRSLGQNLPVAGLRITAVPVGGELGLPRLFRRMDHLTGGGRVILSDAGREFEVFAPRLPSRGRPILRGVRYTFNSENGPSYLEIYSSGKVTAGFRAASPQRGEPCRMYLVWLLGYLVAVLKFVDALRSDAELPDCEYAIEWELHTTAASALSLRSRSGGFDDEIGTLKEELPLIFPRLSYGTRSEIHHVISAVAGDYYDAAGVYLENAPVFRLVRG